MIDESMDKEQMKKPPQPWEFRSKPAWQRLIVMLAGVFMNVVLGVLILTFLHLHYNKSYTQLSAVEEGIYPSEYAMQIGFQKGDIITHIDGKPIIRGEDLGSTHMFFGESVDILRNGNPQTITLPDTLYSHIVKGNHNFISLTNFAPIVESVVSQNAKNAGLLPNDQIVKINETPVNAFGDLSTILQHEKGNNITLNVLRNDSIVKLHTLVDTTGRIGFAVKIPEFPQVKYTFFSAMKYGWKDAFEAIRANAKGLGKVFTGQEKATDSLQGPIGIAKIFGGTWHWQRFWYLSAIISMVLAFMNILPIPALDGGHALFTVIEMIIGRKLPDKFMEVVQVIGLILVLGLMVFIIGNDLFNVIFK